MKTYLVLSLLLAMAKLFSPSTVKAQATTPLNTGGCGGDSLNTAIGCIPIGDQQQLIGFILGWAIGIAGGIAFIFIVISSFQIMTASGNPDRIRAGQELLTSAITGLLLIIFSVFLLKFIGVDILHIPGIQ